MMGFIAAALPWVMMGVALAIYLTTTGARKAGDKKRDSGRVSFAMGMGLLAGFLVSFVGLVPLNWGLGIGALLGALMGAVGQ